MTGHLFNPYYVSTFDQMLLVHSFNVGTQLPTASLEGPPADFCKKGDRVYAIHPHSPS